MRTTEIEVTTTEPDLVTVLDNKYVLLGKTAFVFTLDDNFITALKGDYADKIEGIYILPIKFSNDIATFRKCLDEMFEYIIFDNQKCVDNVMIVAGEEDFYKEAVESIEKNSTLITRTNEMFPVVDTCAFNRQLPNLTMNWRQRLHWSYWITITHEIVREEEEINSTAPQTDPEYKDTGDYFEPYSDEEQEEGSEGDESSEESDKPKFTEVYYECEGVTYDPEDELNFLDKTMVGQMDSSGSDSSSSGSESSGGAVKYKRVKSVDTTTFNMKQMFGKSNGDVGAGLTNSNSVIVIKYYTRPDDPRLDYSFTTEEESPSDH